MGVLSRAAGSAAASEIGWQYVNATLRTSVEVGSTAEAAAVAAIASEASEESSRLELHLTAHRVELTLRARSGLATEYEVSLARAITAALAANGHTAGTVAGRPPQVIEFAIDAMDIPKIRPFWQAVLAYVPDPSDPEALVDPLREGPSMWFQQMDEPRDQRNRIHFDVMVPHTVADERIAEAVAAGGHVVSDARARAFWILADAEGNEICVCTWEDRNDDWPG